MVAVELDVPVIDLDFAHTLSQHNRGALLNGSQHTDAWRVRMKGRKPYLYHNTAH